MPSSNLTVSPNRRDIGINETHPYDWAAVAFRVIDYFHDAESNYTFTIPHGSE